MILIAFKRVLKNEKISVVTSLEWLLSTVSIYLLLNSLPKKVIIFSITYQCTYRKLGAKNWNPLKKKKIDKCQAKAVVTKQYASPITAPLLSF